MSKRQRSPSITPTEIDEDIGTSLGRQPQEVDLVLDSQDVVEVSDSLDAESGSVTHHTRCQEMKTDENDTVSCLSTRASSDNSLDSSGASSAVETRRQDTQETLTDSAPPALPTKQCLLPNAQLLSDSGVIMNAADLQAGATLRALCGNPIESGVSTVKRLQVLAARERDIFTISLACEVGDWEPEQDRSAPDSWDAEAPSSSSTCAAHKREACFNCSADALKWYHCPNPECPTAHYMLCRGCLPKACLFCSHRGLDEDFYTDSDMTAQNDDPSAASHVSRSAALVRAESTQWIAKFTLTADHFVVAARAGDRTWMQTKVADLVPGQHDVLVCLYPSLSEVRVPVAAVAHEIRSDQVIEMELVDNYHAVLLVTTGTTRGLFAAVYGSPPRPNMEGCHFRSFFEVKSLEPGASSRQLTQSRSDPTDIARERVPEPLRNARGGRYFVRRPHDDDCQASCRHHLEGRCAKGKLCGNCHDPSHALLRRHRKRQTR